MATGRPVVKAIIKYNSNCLEENNEEEKEPVDAEFTEQNAGLEIIKMDFTIDDQVCKKTGRYCFG